MIAFTKAYGTDEVCRAHMESVRWPSGPVRPKCGSVNDAVAISTRPGQYRCRACGKHFTVTVGTAMEGSHLPLHVWYLAMYLMLSTAKPAKSRSDLRGISAMSLSRQTGIQYRTCWHLLHRLRAMLAGGEKLPLPGIVKADESYIGGKVENLPKSAPRPEKRGRGTTKPMLFAAIQRGGEARTPAIPSASAAAIVPALWVWTGGAATLMTDELSIYRWIGRKMTAHHRVTHSKGEYGRTMASGLRAHTNTVEGFFGLFKRGVVGIHHRISAKHLHRYATEHEFHYNTRHDATSRIAKCLIGRHGRLRLRELFA